jgi:N-carbamoylputrescine amidase
VRVALLDAADWRSTVPAARGAGADVICLPQLSFCPYVPATRDRDGLELAERAPSASLREAAQLAGGAWLAASAYESEGEGVFYVTASLGRGEGPSIRHRQHVLEASPGRFEQLFFSPGHGDRSATIELPWGATGTLVGADLSDPGAWRGLARAGARFVLGGASEPAERWARTRRVVAGMAAAYGIVALAANRGTTESGVAFAGGGLALGADGTPITIEHGMVEIP